MRKQNLKLIAGVLAAAMALPAAVNLAEPLRAGAYELLGEGDFDFKIAPWQALETFPAKQEFSIDGGAAHIMILQAQGSGANTDLEFRHRNLDFKKGHVYKVSFKVKAARSGMELISHIGNLRDDAWYFVLDGSSMDMHMGPDMGGQWPINATLTTEYQTFTGTFKPTEDIEAAVWRFDYAYDTHGYGGNAQNGDEIWFDEMTVEDTTADGPCGTGWDFGYRTRGESDLQNNYISVNQIGYFPQLAKIAVLGDNGGDLLPDAPSITLEGRYQYEIVRVSDGEAVYTNWTSNPTEDKDSGDTVCEIDFSKFDQPGEYYIRIKGKEWQSYPFRIADDLYSESGHDLLTNAINYFYQNRANDDISAEYITSGNRSELAHAGDLTAVTGYVLDGWKNTDSMTPYDVKTFSSATLLGNGGWYESDSYDKSVTEGGLAVWTLQNMYERAIGTEDGKAKFADGSGTVVIPENKNQVPDILDECSRELDFMSKLRVSSDSKTYGDYAGLYYHGICGVGIDPARPAYDQDEEAVYAVLPPTYAATLSYAAVAAQAARLWAPYDADYAAKLLEGAKEAYHAYQRNYVYLGAGDQMSAIPFFAPEWHPDYDLETEDDAYWAACELYLTAKALNEQDADTYLTDLTGYLKAFEVPLRCTYLNDSNDFPDNGSYTPFRRENTGAMGSLSLLLHKDLLPAEEAASLRDSLIAAADDYAYTVRTQGYGTPYKYDGPGTGSGVHSDPTQIVLYGYEFDSNTFALRNMMVMAYAYDETANTDYLNGVVKGLDYLFGCNPLSFSFVTGYGSYHAENPMHKFWAHALSPAYPKAPDGVIVSGPNGSAFDPAMRALGLYYAKPDVPSQRLYADNPEAWSANAASLSSNAALAWVISFMQDANNTPAVLATGDVDADGGLSIADAVIMHRWLLADTDSKMIDWKAGDFDGNGRLNAADLSKLKHVLINSFLDGRVG